MTSEEMYKGAYALVERYHSQDKKEFERALTNYLEEIYFTGWNSGLAELKKIKETKDND